MLLTVSPYLHLSGIALQQGMWQVWIEAHWLTAYLDRGSVLA